VASVCRTHIQRTCRSPHASDLEAVLDALEIDECDLLGIVDAGMIAIEFCARTPGRAQRLVLWSSYADRDAVTNNPKTQSLRALWDQDWFQYTELAVHTVLGWKHSERAAILAAFYRAAATQESLVNVVGALYGVDLTLANVQIPTLVVAVDNSWVDLTEPAGDSRRACRTPAPHRAGRHRNLRLLG
jgi:pimeloyl-ACP methyl ester carboxylesterase